MRGLTLTQPWATLVSLGAKRIETRGWRTGYRGPVAIHAAKGLGPAGGLLGLVQRIDEEPFHKALEPYWKYGAGWDCYHIADQLPRGAIVAVARLVACEPTDGPEALHGGGWDAVGTEHGPWPLTAQERAFGDYSPGRYAWLWSDVRPLREPVPCRGALSLWAVPAEVQAQIEAQT